MATTVVQGNVNSLTGTYADKTPKVEIRVPHSRAKDMLPFRKDEHVPIRVKIGNRWYGGMLHHSSGTPFVYFSPTLTRGEKKTRLGKVLTKYGVRVNDRVQLKVNGHQIQVCDKWGNGLETSASRINHQIGTEPKSLAEIREASGVTNPNRFYSHIRSLRKAQLVTKLPDRRYIEARTVDDFPEGTIVQRILKAVAAILHGDFTKEFSRRDVRDQLGLAQEVWVRSHSPLFQGMRSDHPGGAPNVASDYQKVFRRVSHGVYRLTERGEKIISGLPVPAAPPPPAKTGGGAGFGNSENNALVESAARDAVIAKYEGDKWSVHSVEAEKCGHDLVCRKGKEERHVEVKGVSGTEQAFVITAGEVNAAKKDPSWYLCVVTCALLPEKLQITEYDRGEFLVSFDCKVISYMARLNP